MAFDFKKEYKEFYMPKNKPEIVTVPAANYIAVRGQGDPNEAGGAYQQAIGILYAVAYTLKMSYKTDYKIKGFFEYVVPPLEGFWWQEGVQGVDYKNKSAFHWISVIRLPEFVTKEDFDWAVETATKKKKMDCSAAEFLTIEEGLCVQIMHLGAFDEEPATIAIMDRFLEENGYVNDMNRERLHHEIYMSDARKVPPDKWKTVIRHPIIPKMLYHGSVFGGLDVILANAKSHVDENKVAYFTTDRVYALVCCRTREENFVTMGPKDGVQHYFERFPDQLKVLYDGREGYLYQPLSVRGLKKGKGNSWVSREDVPVSLKEHIPNVYPEILKEEAAGNVIIHRYGEIDPAEQKMHANYMRDHLDDMAEYKDFLIKHFSSLWD